MLTREKLIENIKAMESQGAPYEDIQSYITAQTSQANQVSETKKPEIFTAEKTPGILGGLARFVGVEKLGQGIGKTLFNLTPEAKMTEDMLAKGQISPEKYQDITTGGITNKQVIGSGIQTAANIGLMGLNVKPAATVAGRIGQSAVQGAGIGALGGGVASYEKGDTSEQIIKQAMFTGSIGGVLGGAIGAASEGIKYATQKLPERLYNSAIKPTLQDTKKAIKYNGDTLGKDLIKRGLSGSDQKLLDTSFEKINEAESKLQSLLAQSPESISRKDLSPYLDELIKVKDATPGLKGEVDAIKKVLEQFPNQVPVAQANQIKRNLYDALRDTAFKLDANLSTKKDAMKALARGIKTEIEKKFGEGTISEINKDLATYGKLNDRMVDVIARNTRYNILGISDAGTAVGGAVVGSAFGPGGGLTGGIIAPMLKKLVGTTGFKTATAVGLDKLGQGLQRIPIESTGKISKALLLDLFKQYGR